MIKSKKAYLTPFALFNLRFLFRFLCCFKFFKSKEVKPKPLTRISFKSGKYSPIKQFDLKVNQGVMSKQHQEVLEKQVNSISPIKSVSPELSSPSVRAFMDTISWAEGTYKYGYKTHYGGFAYT